LHPPLIYPASNPPPSTFPLTEQHSPLVAPQILAAEDSLDRPSISADVKRTKNRCSTKHTSLAALCRSTFGLDHVLSRRGFHCDQDHSELFSCVFYPLFALDFWLSILHLPLFPPLAFTLSLSPRDCLCLPPLLASREAYLSLTPLAWLGQVGNHRHPFCSLRLCASASGFRRCRDSPRTLGNVALFFHPSFLPSNSQRRLITCAIVNFAFRTSFVNGDGDIGLGRIFIYNSYCRHTTSWPPW
jgi:hypothetical protein